MGEKAGYPHHHHDFSDSAAADDASNSSSTFSHDGDSDLHIFVRICNLSTAPLTVELGTSVALCLPFLLMEEAIMASLDLGSWDSDGSSANAASDVEDIFSISAIIRDGVFDEIFRDLPPVEPPPPDGSWDVPVNLEKSDLSPEHRAIFTRIVREYYPAFSRHKEDLGLSTVGVELILDTGDAPPTSQAPYRCSKDEELWLEQKIRTWVKNRIIQHSNSQWAAPCTLVKKKDGGYRLVIDYRKLNAVLRNVGMFWPLTLIDSCLDSMSGAQYFSALDINQAFEQLPVEASSIDKTAFVCKYGQYEFLRAPQGVKNMPSTFAKLTDLVFQGLKWKVVNIFADDILVFSKDFDQHCVDVALVLQRLIAAGLKLNPDKCFWAQSEVEYLGHLINRDGILPSRSKTASIDHYPVPRNAKQTHSFVSLCSYYRRFIRSFSDIAAPLNSLVNSPGKFIWTQACQDAFFRLKKCLTEAPVLIYPNFSQPFFLSTDASNYGLGAILFQLDELGRERVISYASRTLVSAEKNYSTTHREGLGVIWAIKKFHVYLYGRKFTVITDHKPLTHLFDVKDATGRLYRWSIKLQEYDFQIVYKPGRSHINADILSRIPENILSAAILAYDDEFLEECPSSFPECPTTPSPTFHADDDDDADGTGHHATVFSSFDVCAFDNPAASTGHLSPPVTQLSPSMSQAYDTYAPDWSFSMDLHLEQRTDPHLATIISELTLPVASNNPSFVSSSLYDSYYLDEQTGLLMHLYFPTHSRKIRDAFHQVVLPQSLRHYVLRAYHDSPLSGHMGGGRTYAKILQKYFWPSLRQDVFNYATSCHICQTAKTPRRRLRAPLGQQPQVWAPFQRIAIDLLALSPTPRGHHHVLVVVDAFTRWVELFPLKDTTAPTIARLLYDNIISRFGCPKYLLSDNGPEFSNQVVRELCQILGIRKIFTTAHHPQSNGLVERSNSSVLNTLKTYTDDVGSNWDLYLPPIRFALNTAINTTTQETPYFLLYGIDPALPVDVLLHNPELSFPDMSVYMQDLVRRLQHAHKIASDTYNATALKTKTKNDQASSLLNFHLNDKVWLYVPIVKKGTSRKLIHPWHGPYRVAAKHSDYVFSVLPCDRSTSRPIKVHISRLKPYKERTMDVPSLPSQDLYAEDPVIALDRDLPSIPPREQRIVYENPDIPFRDPTPQELSYVGKQYQDPDDRKFFLVIGCSYSKSYKEIIYEIAQLKQHRNGSFSRLNKKVYQCTVQDLQSWVDNYEV